MKTIYNLILCFILSGCAAQGYVDTKSSATDPVPGVHYTMHLHQSSLPGNMIDLIIAAAGEWENATNVIFDIDVSEQSCAMIKSCIEVSSETWAEIVSKYGAGNMAITHNDFVNDSASIDFANDMIFLNNMTATVIHIMMLHEIGHALGLHHDVDGTIMFWSIGSARSIALGDIDQYKAIRLLK